MSAESSSETTNSVVAVKPMLDRWNTLAPPESVSAILPCCGSLLWAQQLAASRPVHDLADLLHRSDAIWQKLPPEAWEEAFATHPRIGARKAPSTATGQSAMWSSQEQSSVSASSTEVQQQLAHGNDIYEQRFGRTYIVCATGKTATEMLAVLERRLTNDVDQEFAEAGEEQRLITRLRLQKWSQR